MNTVLVAEIRPSQVASTSNMAAEQSGERSQLAVFGGPRAVTKWSWERWRTSRLTDLLPVVPFLIRGLNTTVRGGLIDKFESRFAKLTNSRYALLMNSGTAALHSAFMAV